MTDGDGTPVSGVIVKIYRWGAPQPLTAITDDRGFYRFSVTLGTGMSIFTQKEGYVSAWHNYESTAANSFQNARETDLEWDLRIYRIG